MLIFIRELKNRSGSICVQVISKAKGKYTPVKTIGSIKDLDKLNKLKQQTQLENLKNPLTLFAHANDQLIESFISNLKNTQMRVIGPE